MPPKKGIIFLGTKGVCVVCAVCVECSVYFVYSACMYIQCACAMCVVCVHKFFNLNSISIITTHAIWNWIRNWFGIELEILINFCKILIPIWLTILIILLVYMFFVMKPGNQICYWKRNKKRQFWWLPVVLSLWKDWNWLTYCWSFWNWI